MQPFVQANGSVVCPASGSGALILPVLDKNGNTLISAPAGGSLNGATTIGSWTLRATCFGTGMSNPGLDIQAAKPRPAGSLYDQNASHFAVDPLNSTVLSWDVPPSKNFYGSELFAQALRPCRANMLPPTANAAVPQIVPMTGIFDHKEYSNVVQPPNVSHNTTGWTDHIPIETVYLPPNTQAIQAVCFQTAVSSMVTDDCGWSTCNCWNHTIYPDRVEFNIAFGGGWYKSNAGCYNVTHLHQLHECTIGYLIFATPTN